MPVEPRATEIAVTVFSPLVVRASVLEPLIGMTPSAGWRPGLNHAISRVELWCRRLNDGDRDRRWIFRRVVHSIVCDDSMRFVIVMTASIQVPLESRKTAAAHLDTKSVPG